MESLTTQSKGLARGPRAVVLLAAAVAMLAGCSDDHSPVRPPAPRTYFMGFSSFPPRPDLNLLVTTIDAWAPRADAGLILTDPPWAALLAGENIDSMIRNNQLGLANYFRSKGLRVIASIDLRTGSTDRPRRRRSWRLGGA